MFTFTQEELANFPGLEEKLTPAHIAARRLKNRPSSPVNQLETITEEDRIEEPVKSP